MGRSANSFAFLLVFVLLALVIYFIYQAATGTGATSPTDQASFVALPKSEKPDPNRFLVPPATEPAEPATTNVTPAPPGESTKEPAVAPIPPVLPVEPVKMPDEGKKADEGEGKKSDEPPPPKLPDVHEPPKAPGEPSVPGGPTPVIGTQEELLPIEKEYTTQPGDTPWLLAVVLLGDGTRWPDIVAANPALAEGGRPADKETALPAGLRIRTPKDAAPQEKSPAPQDKGSEHKVQAGDTLSAIMQRYYGESSMAIQKEILAENPDLDPDVLQVNTSIKLPVIPGKGPKSGT